MTRPDDWSFRYDEEARHFVAEVQGLECVLEVEPLSGDLHAFTHTHVPPELRGRRLGLRLVREALEEARRRGWKVLPLCPFVPVVVRRYPEFRDLVVEREN